MQFLDLAGETRFEHATYGFGDRYDILKNADISTLF